MHRTNTEAGLMNAYPNSQSNLPLLAYYWHHEPSQSGSQMTLILTALASIGSSVVTI